MTTASHPSIANQSSAEHRMSMGVLGAARLGSLQAFQARIAEKIANAQSAPQAAQSLLAVQVGPYKVYMSLLEMNGLMTLPAISAVPLAKQWMKGLAVVRAEVVTVLDLAYCLGVCLSEQRLIEQVKSSAVIGEMVSQSKLVMLSPLIQNQLAFTADKVFGIVADDSGVLGSDHLPPDIVDNAFDDALQGTHSQGNSTGSSIARTKSLHPASLQADGLIIKRIVYDVKGDVFIELSLAELLKSTIFLNLTY